MHADRRRIILPRHDKGQCPIFDEGQLRAFLGSNRIKLLPHCQQARSPDGRLATSAGTNETVAARHLYSWFWDWCDFCFRFAAISMLHLILVAIFRTTLCRVAGDAGRYAKAHVHCGTCPRPICQNKAALELARHRATMQEDARAILVQLPYGSPIGDLPR